MDDTYVEITATKSKIVELEKIIAELEIQLSREADKDVKNLMRQELVAKNNQLTAKNNQLTEWLKLSAGTVAQVSPLSALVEQQLQEITAELFKLKSRFNISVDSRLYFFSNAMPASSGKHSAASTFCKNAYQSTCVFCGVTHSKELPVTMAHIVAGNHCVNYSGFGPPLYKDELNVKSHRNFIPLCGVLGMNGSCHDLFDKYLLALVYRPLNQDYMICCMDENNTKVDVNGDSLHLKVVPLKHEPYRRLLAWRTRKCIMEHGYKLPDHGEKLLKLAEFSECSCSILDSNEEEEDEEDIET